jgi:hypothetical protein
VADDPPGPPCPPPQPEPECPPQPDPYPCEPTYVPVTLEIAPVVSLYINKPKICVVNNAVCIPRPRCVPQSPE